ncbi:MAG: hypothetical protein E7292_04875 [Lachnospiraceae bacterium]|nr:hypothetical protein [Lachnospiraceae bacterium]
MKKFLVLTCMIACLFGMTACSEEEQLTTYEQSKVDSATVKAENIIIPVIQSVLLESEYDMLHEYTPEEVEYRLEKYTMNEEIGEPLMTADGNAFVGALDSFKATYEEMGGYGKITGSTAKIDDDQIIVNVDIDGENCDAKAEIILSNDRFLKLEAASLNKVSTMSDAMAKAGMNTLLGMGSVFAVLILISLIISCFSLISKFQAWSEKRKAEKAAKETPKAEPAKAVEKAVAQIAAQEAVATTDDTELIAVIAAAIAASEGATSTDGFVVRSIKRRRA